MKRLFPIAILLALCGVSGLAQGIVWNWLPNPYQGPVFPNPIGYPVFDPPDVTVVSVPISMAGNGTADFQLQALTGNGPPDIQVLPAPGNAVLSISYSPPNIGQEAVLLTSGQVSSLNPVGAWLGAINASPYAIGSDLIFGDSVLGYGGQFINQEGYVGVQFDESDGIHYGALDVAGSTDLGLSGFLYGYGYNPVAGQPFDLADVPPIPEPQTLALLAMGALLIIANRALTRLRFRIITVRQPK